MLLKVEAVLTFIALLGLVSGRVFVPESIVSTWPKDMALRIGQEGRMNFTLLPGKSFTLLGIKALFVGGTVSNAIYYATPSRAAILPGFTDYIEIIEGSKHDLKILSMSSAGAGQFLASVTHTNLDVEEKQFTVVAIDQATCSASKTDDVVAGDVVSLDCSARYTGDKAPMMKWKDANGRDVPGSVVVPPKDGDGPDRTTPSPTVPKKVLYRANVTASPEHDGQRFTCSLFFEDPITYTDDCTTSFRLR